MNEFQNVGYGGGQQLAPQGIFGGMLGAPLGGLAGRGIGGLFGNPQLGSQIGQAAGGIGGGLLPFGTDPVAAAHAQQQLQQQLLQQQLQQQQLQQLQQLQQQQGQMGQQMSPQGWIGNLIGQAGQPLGSAIGGVFGQPGLGSSIGNVAGQIGRMLPFGADPIAAAYAQQQLQQQLQQAQQAQQGQLSPQGWVGNLIGQVGQPLGGAIGGIFGQSGLGSSIGNVAGQLGRLLPFGADPQLIAQAMQQQHQQLQQQIQQLQQQLMQQQQQYAQLAQSLGQQGQQFGQPGQQFGQQGQQGQFAPQGWLGSMIGQVGRPLGSAIGGMFGNAGLGGTIGAAAGQFGQMLPFGTDPVTAAYIQQAQLAQQSQPTLH
jgi:hypothetical protein